jgi:hypothetical protein
MIAAWMQVRWNQLRAEVKTFNSAVYWIFLVLSAIAAIYLIFFPSTVLALTVLAVPPILALLRQAMGEKEKLVWVAISIFLIVGVYRGLRQDQRDQENAQNEILCSFRKIGNQLSDTTKKLGDIAELEQKTLTTVTLGLNDTINTFTGGNSFCYVDIVPVTPEKNAVNHSTVLEVVRVGKYPLHGITMVLNGAARMSIPDFATPKKAVSGVYHLSGEDHESFSVSFSANNGLWLERLELRRLAPDKWVKAMWVEAPANPYYVRIDKDYPRKANGEPDVPWPRVAKTGAPAWEKPKY